MIDGQLSATKGTGENAAGGCRVSLITVGHVPAAAEARNGFYSMVKLGNATKNVHMNGGLACRQ